MKIYKWNKRDVDLVKLLNRVGAVNGNRAYPSQVFVSPKRYKEMRKEVLKVVKSELKGASTKRINYHVGMYMLNLAPVELKGLPDNIVLVDDLSIENEIKGEQTK